MPSKPDTTALADCPVGLFIWDGALCLKTEYGSNDGRIDAYIVASGEFFWGPEPQTTMSQRSLQVRPVTDDMVEAFLRQTTERMVRLSDVIRVIEGQASAPDGYYHARQTERIHGWQAAASRIRQKIGRAHG